MHGDAEEAEDIVHLGTVQSRLCQTSVLIVQALIYFARVDIASGVMQSVQPPDPQLSAATMNASLPGCATQDVQPRLC